MQRSEVRPQPTAALPLRPQDEVECRRCEVHCDKVVYPSACVERACPFLYAYVDHGHTFVGCMQKVFGVEIDLDLLRSAEARREGFGAMCRTEVDRCYESRADELTCVNPEFFELPLDRPTFRVFAQVTPGS